jgi:hypothetical protein
MKPKLTLAWIFVLTGTSFLISGLVVMIFATLRPGMDGPAGGLPDPSFWVNLANMVMQFIIDLLEVDWTPIRVGVFLIIVGVIFDGGGAYLIMSSEAKPKRRSTRRSTTKKTRRK